MTYRATADLFKTRLKPHPLSVKVYGEPAPSKELIESIDKVGVLAPILVWKSEFILSGNSRWAAVMKSSNETIPCTYFQGTDLEAEQIVIESNRQRVKTEAQKDAEAAELVRIESELAAARQALGKYLPKVDSGKAVEKVAEQTGESAETVRKRVEIHEAKIPAEERNQQSTNAVFENLPKPTPCRFADSLYCEEILPSKKAEKQHAKDAHGKYIEQMKQRRLASAAPSLREVVEPSPIPSETAQFDSEAPAPSSTASAEIAKPSRTSELRSYLKERYPYSNLRPSEHDQRQQAAGKTRHRTDRYDIALNNLTKAEVRAIADLFAVPTSETEAA